MQGRIRQHGCQGEVGSKEGYLVHYIISTHSTAKKKTMINNKGNTDTYGFLDCQETMAHPAPSGTIAANVRKTFLMVTIRGTERYLLNGLVHD